MSEYYNAKIVKYKNKVEIIKYSEMKIKSSGIEKDLKLTKPDLSDEAIERRAVQQAYRIKRKIKHYVLANNFDLFWTLTFDENKVDSYNYKEVSTSVKAWLKYQREKFGRFGYIFLPELHKSGRIHFHGITENFNPPLIEARSKKTNRLIKIKGKQVYNAETWKNGFSTVSEIEDSDKTASYITKYITKEVFQMPTAFNQPRYLVSRGLNNPEISYLTLDEEEIENFTPSFVSGELNEDNILVNKISIYNLDIENGNYLQNEIPTTTYKANEIKKSSTENLRKLAVDDYSYTSD